MSGLKYGIVGSKGKMGREIMEYFSSFGDECVVEKDVDHFVERDVPQLIIDFSSPQGLKESVELCRKYNCGLIVGTTGLTDESFRLLGELSKTLPVVQSYNFSSGMSIMKEILKAFREQFKDWDCAMIEIHHSQKKDAPSGTAKMLKEVIQRDLSISSIRVGGIFGEHTVIFSNAGEVVEISHRALSRRAFSIGVRRAALFLLTKEKGFFTYEDVLKGVDKAAEELRGISELL
ncbi:MULTISPECIES: 4-hydroxy-tetrahydrodipicolinate reductase [Pseudothermotoga]|uniref:4-hydroxy-tetrahydrodipicolinate reductase n=1 Tax=Pseudothermotoga TaxID=1643951 RepID=UPI00042164C1|nr:MULTISPECIES: dihydrodipicolinate reductase C-terminal domain-containing protein [Pseudothermotoga]MDI6862724.1 dihydrodipicolinate reductase C-terminal domain-containing protein [Pseudothermotoga sp.]